MFQSVPLSSKLGALGLAGSGALLGGAYYFQYVQGLAPCDLCFWQRYPHMVAIAAGLAAVASVRYHVQVEQELRMPEAMQRRGVGAISLIAWTLMNQPEALDETVMTIAPQAQLDETLMLRAARRVEATATSTSTKSTRSGWRARALIAATHSTSTNAPWYARLEST